MTDVLTLASLWLGLALVATLLAIWLRIATAMSEIVVGTVAQLAIGARRGCRARHRSVVDQVPGEHGCDSPDFSCRCGARHGIRARSFVSIPALIAAPLAFLLLLGAKMVAKFVGVYPVTRSFASPRTQALYTTMLMSTGLTFGSISALFGLSHGIVSQAQYSYLIAAVIGSALVPTLIANAFFLPRHLLPRDEREQQAAAPQPITAAGSGK